MRQFLISPSIDPLSDKNKDLTSREIDTAMAGLGVPRDKPIITQVSRFDYMKDPVGVIQAYRLVKKVLPVQLVLAGGGAANEPRMETGRPAVLAGV